MKCFKHLSYPVECYNYLHENFGHLMRYAREKAVTNKKFEMNENNTEKVIKNRNTNLKESMSNCSNFEQTAVHLLEYYFPRQATYGPAFSPSDPCMTNMLKKIGTLLKSPYSSTYRIPIILFFTPA